MFFLTLDHGKQHAAPNQCQKSIQRPITRIAYFSPGPDGEDDVREEGLRPDGAVEGDDTSQERPEDHQDVDVSAGRPWLHH